MTTGLKKLNKSVEDKTNVISDATLPDTIDEIKEAFRLLYDTYISSGLQNPDPSSMKISFHNLRILSYLLGLTLGNFISKI